MAACGGRCAASAWPTTGATGAAGDMVLSQLAALGAEAVAERSAEAARLEAERLADMEELAERVRLTLECASRSAEPDETETKDVKWTQSTQFTCAICAVVVLNALIMGAEADYREEAPQLFNILEHVFCTVFVLELLLHIRVEGLRVYGRDRMNKMDAFLVVTSVIDVWILGILGPLLGLPKINMKLVSLLRLLRFTRLTRLVRLFRMFKELTLVAQGFLMSVTTLFWAFVFLLVIVYSAAIFVRQVWGGPGSDFVFNPEIGDNMILFGRVDHTMLTLFFCLTEGCGMEVIRPTVMVAPLMMFFWVPFIFFTTFGLLNLIVGIFCENAMTTSADSDSALRKSQELMRAHAFAALLRAFEGIDEDRSRDLSRDEFMHAVEHDEVISESFITLGLDKEPELFDMLDAERRGRITFLNLCDGALLVMKGQDTARVKDFVSTNLLAQSMHRAAFDAGDACRDMRRQQAGIDRDIAAARICCERAVSIAGAIDQRLEALTAECEELQHFLCEPLPQPPEADARHKPRPSASL